MPTSVLADDDEQIIADLQRDVRRLRSRLATTAPRGGHDAWTAAASPATTYQLSTIPVSGTCEFAINGHEQREGTDYTVNADTGLVTVLATLASGDKLVARYLVTDWLAARSLTPDTGLAFVGVATAQHPFGFSSIPVGIPTGAVGDLLILIHSGFNDTSDPTGWTALTDVIASGTTLNCRLSVWTRVADGTEGSSVSLTDAGDSDVAACLRYSGVGSYTDTTWSSTNVADSITTPTATASEGNFVLSIWAWEEINTSAALTVTTDAAVTARVPKVQWDQACLAVGEEVAAASGTTTGRTATATNSTSGASRCAMTMVLSA